MCDPFLIGNTLSLSLLRAPKSPDPHCDIGKHVIQYALFPHVGGSVFEGDVVAVASMYNAPLERYKLSSGDPIGQPSGEPSGQPSGHPSIQHVELDVCLQDRLKKASDFPPLVSLVYPNPDAKQSLLIDSVKLSEQHHDQPYIPHVVASHGTEACTSNHNPNGGNGQASNATEEVGKEVVKVCEVVVRVVEACGSRGSATLSCGFTFMSVAVCAMTEQLLSTATSSSTTPEQCTSTKVSVGNTTETRGRDSHAHTRNQYNTCEFCYEPFKILTLKFTVLCE